MNKLASDPKGERFAWMLEESKRLSALINVPETLIIDIYKCPTDWEFILKIDALLEAAVRKVIKVAMPATTKIATETVERFVDALPMRGRTSLLMLLEGTGCDKSEIELIDCVRRLRNAFAHDIAQVDSSLIEVVKRHGDKLRLLKGLSYTKEYEVEKLIQMFENDGSFLRFTIVTGTLTFLILAYHGVIKEQDETSTSE